MINPDFVKTLSFGPFVNSSNLNLIGTKYIGLNQNTFTNSTYQVLLQNKTFFNKNFNIKSLNINNFYELSYNYQPIDNTNNPVFDYKDYQSNQNYVDFKINNSFSYRGFTFANLYLEEGYTFLKKYAFPTYLSSLDSFVTSSSYQNSNLIVNKPILPLRTTLTLRPFQNISYTLDSFYDFNKNEFPEENQFLNIGYKKLNFYVGDSVNKDINKRYTLNQQSYGASYTYKTFSLNGGVVHDDISGHDVSRYLNLTYNGECYAVSLAFQEYYDGTRNQYINYVLLTFNLFNLQHFTFPISR
jgi:LPS-assembly protein